MHTRLALFALLAALALGIGLGSVPLLDADEGRNAEVGREMAVTNDYVLPRLNELPYLDKPIVYFAAEAAAMEVLGPTELAARLPAYLFTLATAALLFVFGRRLYDDESAWVAVIAFLSMPLTIAFARTVIFDSALTFFITGATMCFWMAVESDARATRRKWSVIAWVAIGFGILTKGPVAILLPLIVAIPYAIRRKRFGALWSIWGIAACALVVAPWVWAVMQQVPDFLSYVVLTETAARLATSELKRTGPPWYFLPYLIGGTLAWAFVLLPSWRELKRREHVFFLLLWVLVPFVFFSISQSKRPQYILPLLPGIALLVAAVCREARTRAAAICSIVLGVILCAAPLVPAYTRKMPPVIVDEAKLTAVILGLLFVATGVVALLFAQRRRVVIAALALPVLALPVVATPLLQALGERRSAHAFVAELQPHLTRRTRIIGIEAFTGSMAFYLRRPVLVATSDGSEWTSNYILRRYERYSTSPTSTLKPLAWGDAQVTACCEAQVFITRNNDRRARALLEQQGMTLIADGAHHVAYQAKGKR